MQEIKALIYYSSCTILIFLVAAKSYKKSLTYRLICSFIFATLTFVVIVIYPNLIPFKFSDQSTWFEFVHNNTHFLKANKENEMLNSFTYVNIVKESENCDNLTNPGHVKSFFNYLSQKIDNGDKELPVDLVIVDALFSERFINEIDSVCLKLMKTRKVLFAFEDFEPEGIYTKQNYLDYNCLGKVDYTKTEEQFLDFNLIQQNQDSQIIPSLPYLSYLSFTGNTFSCKKNVIIKEQCKSISSEKLSSYYATNNFIPELYPEIADSIKKNKNLFDLNQDLSYDPYSGTNHLRALESRIRENSSKKIPNIIIIGSFKNDESDLHNSSQGQMHGSVIVASIFTNLMLNKHKNAFLFFITLYCGLFLIYLFIIRKAITPTYQEHMENSLENMQ